MNLNLKLKNLAMTSLSAPHAAFLQSSSSKEGKKLFHYLCHKGAEGLECHKAFLKSFWDPICVKYQIDLQKKR